MARKLTIATAIAVATLALMYFVILGTVTCIMLWKNTPLVPSLRKSAATPGDDGD